MLAPRLKERTNGLFSLDSARPVPSHLPGGGNPPWAEDGQSCFRREGEDSVRSYKTTRIDNISKPGQKRLEANNNGGNDDGNYDNEIIESRKGK